MQEDNNVQPLEQKPGQHVGAIQGRKSVIRRILGRVETSLFLALLSFISSAGLMLAAFAVAIVGAIIGAIVGAAGGVPAQGAAAGFAMGLGLTLGLGFSTVLGQVSGAIVVFSLLVMGFVTFHVNSLKSSGAANGKIAKWSIGLAIFGVLGALAMLGAANYLHELSRSFGATQ